MIVEQAKQKCSHQACTCDVEPGKAYCSSACEEAATAAAKQGIVRTCACGHAACVEATSKTQGQTQE